MSKIVDMRTFRRDPLMANTPEGRRLRMEAASLMVAAMKGELAIVPGADVAPDVREGLAVLQVGGVEAFFHWLGRDGKGPA